MSERWPGLADDGAQLAALGLLRIAGDTLAQRTRPTEAWEQRAGGFLRAWSVGACDGDAGGAQPAAVALALTLARWQAVLVLELHQGDAAGARVWLGEVATTAGERARRVGASRPVMPVVMALVWSGIDAVAAGGPRSVQVGVLDAGQAVRVVERREAFLRREKDHAALVLAAAEATAAVPAELMGHAPGRVRAWLDEQTGRLLAQAPTSAAPWWVPDYLVAS
ncbi:hypothetical protein [Kitasatospora sp. LaBMicrA B282]|uniref:hypothetical protein n=1 Tax=Kitasatospora sp. LaBMicrA B282 TaxID=3420949 RepID=UPI003D101307